MMDAKKGLDVSTTFKGCWAGTKASTLLSLDRTIKCDDVLRKIPRHLVCSYRKQDNIAVSTNIARVSSINRKQDNIAVSTHNIARVTRINPGDSVILPRLHPSSNSSKHFYAGEYINHFPPTPSARRSEQ